MDVSVAPSPSGLFANSQKFPGGKLFQNFFKIFFSCSFRFLFSLIVELKKEHRGKSRCGSFNFLFSLGFPPNPTFLT